MARRHPIGSASVSQVVLAALACITRIILPHHVNLSGIIHLVLRTEIGEHTTHLTVVAVASLMRAVIVFLVIRVIVGSLVDIVCTSEEHRPCMVRVSHTKALKLIAVVCAVACLKVSGAALVILTFQHHVHGIFLLILIGYAKHLVLLRLLVIHLDALHREVRQVLKHYLILSLEEVRTVERQVINLLSVDEYLTILIQFHAGQLLYQSVEHGALGHVEGIGIEHQRVALPHHLHLRGPYHHLVKRTALVVTGVPEFPHIHLRSLYALLPAAYLLHLKVGKGRFVIRMFEAKYIAHRFARHLKIIACGLCSPAYTPCIATALIHPCGVHHCRIRLHQCQQHVWHGSLGKTVCH